MPRYRIKYNNKNNLYYFQIRKLLWWVNVTGPDVNLKPICSANLNHCRIQATTWIKINEWA